MRDGVGGTVAIFIILVFIVIALGYLAFNVNYTKAFRMKNKIISVYEDFDGECYIGGEKYKECNEILDSYAKDIGYSIQNKTEKGCKDGKLQYKLAGGNIAYCVYEVSDKETGDVAYDTSNRRRYKVFTKVDVDIPIIRNIFDFRFFHIHGETKTFG